MITSMERSGSNETTKLFDKELREKKNRRLVHGEPRRMEKIERDRVMGINDIGKMVQNKNLLNLPLE